MSSMILNIYQTVIGPNANNHSVSMIEVLSTAQLIINVRLFLMLEFSKFATNFIYLIPWGFLWGKGEGLEMTINTFAK